MTEKYVTFNGRLIMVGFGAIGQGVLPLLLRHIDMQPAQVLIFAADAQGCEEARTYGVRHQLLALTPENYQDLLTPILQPGDFLLNIAVGVSSVALLKFCRAKNVLYLDIGIEHWQGGYSDANVSPSDRSNYRLREDALALRGAGGPTAVLTHGANPGWVSHLVKQALLNMAQDCGRLVRPETRQQWAQLACDLGVKVIQIAERDWQVAQPRRQPGEFVNTWSADGLINESLQPAELGWGSHEKNLPADGFRHGFGSDVAIYLGTPGAVTRVRSWSPLAGSLHGFLITHGESLSLAAYLSLGEGAKATYRPTVYYAYHPCDEAVSSLHELAGREWHVQEQRRVVRDEIVDGIDELGVLLLGHSRGAYWLGSRLSTQQARKLAPYNSATSLQVCAGVLSGVVWVMQNPACDILEPEDLPFDRLLELAHPYLGELFGCYSDWTPLSGRCALFPEPVDDDDPWQFQNFRVRWAF